jgi:polyisoprenoid-binding protein YceI
MKGPKVLEAESHPVIAFRSTAVRPKGDGAEVTGEVTIRGVTRPMVLDAVIWRQRGTEAGDRSRLTVQLTGRLKRSDFGATGWSDLVGDEVRLTIIARIAQDG